MRVRDHILISTAGGLALSPWLGRSVLGLWAGSVLIDADHYVWFCLRERRLGLRAAMRYFNHSDAPQHAATRGLHTPVALLAALGVGIRRRRLLPVGVGMGLHVALDARHEARMEVARAQALERDRFTCRRCGSKTPPIGTHLMRQPRWLASYRAQDLTALCGGCHKAVHTSELGRRQWR